MWIVPIGRAFLYKYLYTYILYVLRTLVWKRPKLLFMFKSQSEIYRHVNKFVVSCKSWQKRPFTTMASRTERPPPDWPLFLLCSGWIPSQEVQEVHRRRPQSATLNLGQAAAILDSTSQPTHHWRVGHRKWIVTFVFTDLLASDDVTRLANDPAIAHRKTPLTDLVWYIYMTSFGETWLSLVFCRQHCQIRLTHIFIVP